MLSCRSVAGALAGYATHIQQSTNPMAALTSTFVQPLCGQPAAPQPGGTGRIITMPQEGNARRNRLAYLVLLRRVSTNTYRASIIRAVLLLTVAAAVLAGVPTSSPSFWACWLFLTPAVAAVGLDLVTARLEIHGREPNSHLLRWLIDHAKRTSGTHRLNPNASLTIIAALALTVLASWLTLEAPGGLRLLCLALAMIFSASVAIGIFNDHAWFNPEDAPPRWHELLRLISGPAIVMLMAAIVLPAAWPPSQRGVVVAILCLPLVVSFLIWDLDHTMSHITPLIKEEAHAGRELVLRETHGALSTYLRQIEQYARAHRTESPRLFEMAVNANSRLRETMTLNDVNRETSRSTDTLSAPVMTLARAVGASVRYQINVQELSDPDRGLAHVVLNDLVGNALNAGTSQVTFTVDRDHDLLRVAVIDDAPPMPDEAWQRPGTSSACLGARLVALGGSLTVREGPSSKVVTAVWQARPDGTDSRGRL